jgi:hypothetical protein
MIVARQLSGDLSKINPSLALNQQANALPYNPKLEIERYSFLLDRFLFVVINCLLPIVRGSRIMFLKLCKLIYLFYKGPISKSANCLEVAISVVCMLG